MTDLNDIFGYKLYKPPNEEIPIVPEMNVYGEIITTVEPNADIISDRTVQALLESLDGERTIKVEEMEPDMRYEDWSQKAVYNSSVLQSNDARDLQAREPILNQVLLSSNERDKQFSLNSARPEVEHVVAEQRRALELQNQQFYVKQAQIEEQKRLEEEKRRELFLKQQAIAEEERNNLVREQHNQYQQQVLLFQIKQQHQQMMAKEKNKEPASPEQTVAIQKLLLQLAQINPQLALQHLQAFKEYSQFAPQAQQEPAPVKPAVQQPPPQAQQPVHQTVQQQPQAQSQQAAQQKQTQLSIEQQKQILLQKQQQLQQQQQKLAEQQRLQAQRFQPQRNQIDPSKVPLVHNLGSVRGSEPAEFTTNYSTANAIKPTFLRPK